MPKKITTQNFISKAQEIHKGKYIYNKVKYISSTTPICIICPIHGEFMQTPHHHLEGHGCKLCSNESLRKSKAMSLEQFISRAKEIHSNKYEYSKTNYINARTKVVITCQEHGDFEQLPYHHLKGHGCPQCSFEKNANLKRSTTEQFIEKSSKIHGDKYDYSKVEYTNNHTKVCIICPIHGEFWQTPSDHLSGRGCKECSESHGEQYLIKVFKEYGIDFIHQYKIKIDNKINKSGITSIDFYLPVYNVFIEYNGIQHYIPQECFGGQLKFEDYQIPRDNYVRNYCKSKGIKLIEIPYQIKSYDEIIEYLKINASEIFTRKEY